MTNIIEVEVPHEIMDYQSKVAFGLTLRQFVASLMVLFLVIPTYVLLTVVISINNQIANVVIMLMSAPILAYGFIQKDGYTFAEIVKIKHGYHSCYKRRVYQSEPQIQTRFKHEKSEETELSDYIIQSTKNKKSEKEKRKLARISIKDAKRESKTAR